MAEQSGQGEHSGRGGRGGSVVTGAAQLELMSPAARQADFDGAVARDLSGVDPVFLERVRARLEQRIAAQDPSRLV